MCSENKYLFSELKKLLVDPNSLLLPPFANDDFSHDATEFSLEPEAVLIASTCDDIVTAVHYCSNRNIPITLRGAGTGLSGGCVPSPGSLVISTERMTAIKVDPYLKTAICEPGVITKDLMDAAARHSLAYPPDPASYDESTIGGNVAECAGGLRCKRYGVTKDYVIGMEIILADGSILKTGILGKSEGFSLGDLFIASEGTLGIIVSIAVRLIRPISRGSTILVAFPEPRNAGQTVADITRAGIIPLILEFLDGDAAACSNEYEKNEGLEGAGAILLIETDSSAGNNQGEDIKSICERNNSLFIRVETDQTNADQLWNIRRNLSKATKEMAAYRVSEDIVVPISRFPDLVAFVGEMNKKSDLRINSFGHAGDGNLHVNFLASDHSKSSLDEIEQLATALMKHTLSLGGTLTGEHGIGLAKREFLEWEFDQPTLKAMRMVKQVLDPNSILNPDKLIGN